MAKLLTSSTIAKLEYPHCRLMYKQWGTNDFNNQKYINIPIPITSNPEAVLCTDIYFGSTSVAVEGIQYIAFQKENSTNTHVQFITTETGIPKNFNWIGMFK